MRQTFLKPIHLFLRISGVTKFRKMKNGLIILAFTLLSCPVFSQTFNTAHILRPGHFSAGINPVLNNHEPGLYLHGGYGINKLVDLGVRYGILEGQDYFGADLEWALSRSKSFQLSLITGGHVLNDFGFDLGLSLSIPMTEYAIIFTGLDMDFYPQPGTHHYTWLPIGVEVKWLRNSSIILEEDIPMSDWAWNIFGGGIAFYF